MKYRVEVYIVYENWYTVYTDDVLEGAIEYAKQYAEKWSEVVRVVEVLWGEVSPNG